jgi:hypothetical protein
MQVRLARGSMISIGCTTLVNSSLPRRLRPRCQRRAAASVMQFKRRAEIPPEPGERRRGATREGLVRAFVFGCMSPDRQRSDRQTKVCGRLTDRRLSRATLKSPPSPANAQACDGG